MIATRDIKVGEVILREQPLVAGPSQVTPPVCLGCYKLLTEDSAHPCSECGWPVCSENCERALPHRAECDVTKLKKGSKVSVSKYTVRYTPCYVCYHSNMYVLHVASRKQCHSSVTTIRALRVRVA